MLDQVSDVIDEPILQASFPEPREFQNRAHQLLRDGLRAGHKNQLIMAPTGAGKTFLGLRIIYEALQRGKRAVFVCDRTTLINQTSETADRYGLTNHGIIQANHWRVNPWAPFQIASAQTLARRKWPEADVIVVDESHTLMRVWTEHIMKTDAAVIGLSATPFSNGLGKLFSNLINATTMDALTKDGVLVPMRVYSGTKPDMFGAATIAGEWADHEAESRGMEIIGDVVQEWVDRADNRKTIIFGATIKHCEAMAARFNAIGVMAAVFTSHTTTEERTALLKEFRKPDSLIRILISVEALAKGFDVPDVECVADCRPLRKSLSTALQMWGRGLRSYPGKKDCLLLDHSGNIVRFRKDFEEIYFNGLDQLDNGEKLDKTIRKDDQDKSERACPACGYKPFTKRCMSCGHEIVSQALVEEQVGEMRELQIGQKAVVHDRAIWNQVCTYVRTHGKPETARQRAFYLYQDLMHTKPPADFKFDPAGINVPLEKKIVNKVKQKQLIWRKQNAVR
jgi:DNA repair protein RadD